MSMIRDEDDPLAVRGWLIGAAIAAVVIVIACCVIGCASAPVVTPSTPPAPAMRAVAVVVTDGDERLVGALVTLNDITPPGQHTGATDATGVVTFLQVSASIQSTQVTVSNVGCQPYVQTVTLTAGIDQQVDLGGSLTTPNAVMAPPLTCFPPVPTRDEILSAHESFQGLSVTCDGYGTFPWFDAAISSLDATCRQNVYDAKREAGDTVLRIDVSWNYSGDGGYSYPVPGTDLTGNLNQLRALVLEGITAGFSIRLGLAGDGESEASCADYNDPVGHTYGRACAQNSILPAVLDILDDTPGQPALSPYCVFVTGYDGVFYGWTPAEVQGFATAFRALRPNGYLAIEFNTGHIPVGNGPGDYASGGMMIGYDLILGEFDNWPTVGDAEWQILARLLGRTALGGAYVRPPDQPASDDDEAPWYLSVPNPRGKYYVDCLEYAEYGFVRGQVTATQIDTGREYYRAMGCPIVG